MAKYVMIFDKEKCIGCNACVVSCQQNYNMPPENKLNWVTVEESGEFPNLKLEFTPHQCAHCDDPKCIDVCPAEDATFKTKEGYVLINAENCIGCKACIDACPYGARSFNQEEKKAVKCSFCADMVEFGGTPICAATCPTHARIFGDIEDENSQVSKILAEKKVVRLDSYVGNESDGFEPNIYYIGGGND